MTLRAGDSEGLRKERGAFFTPPLIAEYLARWAVLEQADAKIMDPTCGESAFLLEAGKRLKDLGRSAADIGEQLYGFDLHRASLEWARELLNQHGLNATLAQADFLSVPTPDQLASPVPWLDAIIGNPPFVRYQRHTGESRDRGKRAALQQGVRLSNLASSWAALLIHACGFLKPRGRLAMVLPAELLSVDYAEPIRSWLKKRFGQVHLVMFEQLQFNDAIEKVVLVLASGDGGCDAFSLYSLDDATDLAQVRPMSNHAAPVPDGGKWTHLLLSNKQRALLSQIGSHGFVGLDDYGRPALGIVTGRNSFFALNETTRVHFGLTEEAGHVIRICPPGTKHLRDLDFSVQDWNNLRDSGERVWLFRPSSEDRSPEVMLYVSEGLRLGVDKAYKCSMRTPWWCSPLVSPPDLFFTYMSHRCPRLIGNFANATYVNSMHGVRLKSNAPDEARDALPLLAFNSVTMLGAEVRGRSYGGGVLKMEPREAARLPLPNFDALREAWSNLKSQKAPLEHALQQSNWTSVVQIVDEILLVRCLGFDGNEVDNLREAAASLRMRRIGKTRSSH